MAPPIIPTEGPFEVMVKLIGGLGAMVVGLITYTWHRKEKADDLLAKTLTDHIAADDTVHDSLYTENRHITAEMTRIDKELAVMRQRQDDCEKCP